MSALRSCSRGEPGFGCTVSLSAFGFRISVFSFRVSVFGFWDPGSWFLVSSFEFWASSFGFRWRETMAKTKVGFPSVKHAAHIRQSRPDAGLGSQVKVLKTLQGALSSLGSGEWFRQIQDENKYWQAQISSFGPLIPRKSLGI